MRILPVCFGDFVCCKRCYDCYYSLECESMWDYWEDEYEDGFYYDE